MKKRFHLTITADEEKIGGMSVKVADFDIISESFPIHILENIKSLSEGIAFNRLSAVFTVTPFINIPPETRDSIERNRNKVTVTRTK